MSSFRVDNQSNRKGPQTKPPARMQRLHHALGRADRHTHQVMLAMANYDQVQAVLLPLPLSDDTVLADSANIRHCHGLPGLLLLLLPVLRLCVAEGRRSSTLTARAVQA